MKEDRIDELLQSFSNDFEQELKSCYDLEQEVSDELSLKTIQIMHQQERLKNFDKEQLKKKEAVTKNSGNIFQYVVVLKCIWMALLLVLLFIIWNCMTVSTIKVVLMTIAFILIIGAVFSTVCYWILKKKGEALNE